MDVRIGTADGAVALGDPVARTPKQLSAQWLKTAIPCPYCRTRLDWTEADGRALEDVSGETTVHYEKAPEGYVVLGCVTCDAVFWVHRRHLEISPMLDVDGGSVESPGTVEPSKHKPLRSNSCREIPRRRA